MNTETEPKKSNGGAYAYVAAILGAFLIVAGLVGIMRHYTAPAPLGADRAAERRKALKELRASNEEVLNNPGYVWQDAAKGMVRLPINRAMELFLKWGQNPALGRSNLVSRVEKATAKPPPVQFE